MVKYVAFCNKINAAFGVWLGHHRIKLQFRQTRVNAVFFFIEFVVRPLFDDFAAIQDVYFIHFSDCRQTVRNDDARAAFHQDIERILHHFFAFGIKARRGFIEQ
jgi:hypothetical protein